MRCEVPFAELDPTPRNARSHYQRVIELARSIGKNGLLQNLVVTKKPDGRFEVNAGERRRRAIAVLLLSAEEQITQYGEIIGHWSGPVPVFVIPETSDEINLIENIIRENLHPWEIGRRLAEWNDAGFDQLWISQRIDKGRGWVQTHLMLGRQLSPKVIEAIERMGGDVLSQSQMLDICRLYDSIELEPLHEKQIERFEHLLGKPRLRRKPEEPKNMRQRVYERAKALKRVKVPGHARPYVQAVLRFLFDEKKSVRPDFSWD